MQASLYPRALSGQALRHPVAKKPPLGQWRPTLLGLCAMLVEGVLAGEGTSTDIRQGLLYYVA